MLWGMDTLDLDRLANLRHRLRLKAEALIEAYEALSEPETPLEVERSAKAGLMLDRLLLKLYDLPEAASKRVSPQAQTKTPQPTLYAYDTPEWMKIRLADLALRRAEAASAKGLGPQPTPMTTPTENYSPQASP
jgi:hypothetical protein